MSISSLTISAHTSETQCEDPRATIERRLPRLLVLGDVPVEETYHGSLLLYRLLQQYPADKLQIVETGNSSSPKQRLAGAHYHHVRLANPRWLNTRFHKWFCLWFCHRAKSTKNVLPTGISCKSFDAVLTVAHGFGWLAAARIAEDAQKPLHVIVHDDWPRVAIISETFRGWLDKQFRRVYCQAASRMCVSPGMRSRFLELYGKDAEVLFPSRSPLASSFETPPSRLSQNAQPFTVAFAGTINSEGYVRALMALRKAIDEVSGRLLIFGPLDEVAARSYGLDSKNVVIGGLLSPAELLLRLREEADCLFVPMSFDGADRANMELAFPSKLADYTAAGVPLLIYGPDYCSAVRWARENKGVAEVVDTLEELQLISALRRLVNEPALRVQMGERALSSGQKYFGAANAQRLLESALLNSSHSV